MEAADWLESLVMYVPDFIDLVNLGCTPERPIKRGKQETVERVCYHSKHQDSVLI